MTFGMTPAILPALRKEFTLTLTAGINLLFALYLTANLLQILIGHLRPHKSRPLFLYIGILLFAAVYMFDAVPRDSSFPFLILLIIITGFGIAIVHPESLRALHALERISPATGSAVYCAGGSIGFATGGWVSSALVSTFGLKGLYFAILCPAATLIVILSLRLRLAVEPTLPKINNNQTDSSKFNFWPIMIMTIPAAVATTLIVALLPSRLSELEFELTFGGLSVMAFSMAATIGSFFWASIANKKGELPCAIIALFLGVPLLLIYTTMMHTRTAVWLLSAGSFCAAASYPLMVTVARNATGPNLGRRMAFILGGVWGAAGIALRLSAPIAENFGLETVILFAPAGYILSAVGLIIVLKIHNRKSAKNNG